MRVTDLLGLLDRVKRSGAGWTALCPAHDDRNPSLSIREGDDGKTLLHCHADCSAESVCDALGISLKDLFPEGAGGQERRAPGKAFPDASEAEAVALESVRRQQGPTWDLVARYVYCDADRHELMRVLRCESANSSDKTFRPIHRCAKGWTIGGLPGSLPLYRLPQILDSDLVYVTEGEKASDAGTQIGLITTTSAHGSGAAKRADWSPLAGKRVVLLPDNDSPGEKYVKQVEAGLRELSPPPEVVVLRLPDLPPSGDLADFVAVRQGQGRTNEEIRNEIQALVAVIPETAVGDDGDESDSTVAQVLAIARGIELFHSADAEDDQAFASFENDGHTETRPVDSRRCQSWLRHAYYRKHKKAPSKNGFQEAIEQIKANALYDGEPTRVAVRLGGDEDRIYLDLANADWEVIEITKDGWRKIPGSECPLKFIRKVGQKPLPIPVGGGSVDELRPLLNLPDDDAWILLVGCLVSYLSPWGPYCVLVIEGEHGSAKTSACRTVINVIDPKKAALRRPTKGDRDLMIAAVNSWVVGFDNLSGIRTDLSDSLCSLATGSGFGTRELYTNGEEMLFEAARPVVLNGIDGPASRPDLLDRAICLRLKPIPDDRRMEEKDLNTRFEAAHPRVLGALLDAVVVALQNKDSVRLSAKPRMADATTWVTAAEPGLGWEQETFLKAYMANRNEANQAAIEASPVAVAVCQLLEGRDEWEGSCSELLEELGKIISDELKNSRDWPKLANQLGKTLRRSMPNLRTQGLEMEDLPRTGKRGRLIRLFHHRGEKPAELLSLSTPLSPTPSTDPGEAVPGDNTTTEAEDSCHSSCHRGNGHHDPETTGGDKSDTSDNNSSNSITQEVLRTFDGELVEDDQWPTETIPFTSDLFTPSLQDVAALGLTVRDQPCFMCSGTSHWRPPGGQWTCERCHPSPYAEDEIERSEVPS